METWRRIFEISHCGAAALIMWLCVIHSAGGRACVHKQLHANTHQPARNARGPRGTGFLLLLHYSLWNVVFISWLETAVASPPVTQHLSHTHTHSAAPHSSSSQNHFRENSLWQMPRTKRGSRGQKNIWAWRKAFVSRSQVQSGPERVAPPRSQGLTVCFHHWFNTSVKIRPGGAES